ncbi:hypothetical protein [Stutzerimonas stutzeri]|uniref:hypothetical protein n=1 Tax=Stutzerimonas stutzeri TaxID=316 RepID=UPI0030138F38
MFLQISVAGLASLCPLLNSMALLIALGGAWLLLATRWRQQLASQLTAARREASGARASLTATQRVDRFFYGFGFSSLAVAWLLSSFTRLI